MVIEIKRYECGKCRLEFEEYWQAERHENISTDSTTLQIGRLYRFDKGGKPKKKSFLLSFNPPTVGVVLKEAGFGFHPGKNIHVNSYNAYHVRANESLDGGGKLDSISLGERETRKTLTTDATELSEEEFKNMKDIFDRHFHEGFGGIRVEDLVRGEILKP